MAWTLAPSLVALRREANALWPDRSKASDGTIGDTAHAVRDSDHNPDSRGVVRAWDVTSWVGPDGDVADLIVEHLRARRDPRVRYIIWRRRICSSSTIDGIPPWTWRHYNGDNPHDKHAHLSVQPAPRGDDPSPWGLEEAIMPTPQEYAAAVLNTKIRRAWDGTEVTVGGLLSSVHYYAVTGASAGTVPETSSTRPGRPTAYQGLLSRASEPVDTDRLAELIAAKLPAVAADDVRAAIRDVLGSLDEVAP